VTTHCSQSGLPSFLCDQCPLCFLFLVSEERKRYTSYRFTNNMGQKFKVLCLCDFAKFPIYASLLFLYCTVEITQHLCHRSVLDSEWDGDMKGLSQTGALANSSIDAGVSLLQTMQSSVWSQCLFSLHL
jgi:hypothetical protein